MDAKIGNQPNSKVMRVEEITSLMKEGELGAMLDFTVTDKDGKIISQVTKKAESYVQQFLQLLYITMQPNYLNNSYVPTLTPLNVKDTSNVTQTPARETTTFDVFAPSGNVTYGIVVGVGIAAVTTTDYVLGTPIAHGTGSGQLQYGGVTYGAPSANTTTSQLTITRNFANNSGGSITVNEIALYCRAYSGGTCYFMIIRDVIAGGIAVANGQTLTVNYRPQAAI